jgi:carbohydrate-selective porin OprB
VRASLPALVLFVAIILGPASKPAAAEEGLFEQEKLTGDWGGVRKTLKDAGVDFEVNDIAEALSNPVGGVRQRTIYQGLITTSVNLDLEKLANWPGARPP